MLFGILPFLLFFFFTELCGRGLLGSKFLSLLLVLASDWLRGPCLLDQPPYWLLVNSSSVVYLCVSQIWQRWLLLQPDGSQLKLTGTLPPHLANLLRHRPWTVKPRNFYIL